jgi:hypothetical protein
MKLPIRQRRTLRGIERDLTGSDPQLAILFMMFASLTPGENIPDAETLNPSPGRMLARLGRVIGSSRPPACRRSWLWLFLPLTVMVVQRLPLPSAARAHRRDVLSAYAGLAVSVPVGAGSRTEPVSSIATALAAASAARDLR